MNKCIFATRLARTTAATLAVAQINPDARFTDTPPPARLESPKSAAPRIVFSEVGTTNSKSVTFQLSCPSHEWTREQDKEFRRLALMEAKGEISREEMRQLNELDACREILLNPRSAEEIELQLKRDRVLENMSQNFQDYLALKDGSHRKRFATS